MTRPAIVVLTGAGVSADSGLATFRDRGGHWEGRSVDEVATPAAWRRDPALVWRFYQERRRDLAAARPNAAHLALAALERRATERGVPFLLATQNVDDLHERAGSTPLHVHGELLRLRCEACGTSVHDATSLDPERYAPCPGCRHPRLRVDVVWFGETPYFMDEVGAAVARCTRFVAIGTSGVVHPAAGLIAAARARGAATTVQSLDPPANLDLRDDYRPGRAADVVPRLCEEIARGFD